MSGFSRTLVMLFEQLSDVHILSHRKPSNLDFIPLALYQSYLSICYVDKRNLPGPEQKHPTELKLASPLFSLDLGPKFDPSLCFMEKIDVTRTATIGPKDHCAVSIRYVVNETMHSHVIWSHKSVWVMVQYISIIYIYIIC